MIRNENITESGNKQKGTLTIIPARFAIKIFPQSKNKKLIITIIIITKQKDQLKKKKKTKTKKMMRKMKRNPTK